MLLSTLPLLMTGVLLTNYPHNAFPADNLAVLTTLFYGSLYFHLEIPYYLYRYVILPRVRSYGESSIFTLSPGKILIKCILILPETCARTICPFSSSTRNVAFGNVSLIIPSTAMGCSFANIHLLMDLIHVSLKSPAPRPVLKLYAHSERTVSDRQ